VRDRARREPAGKAGIAEVLHRLLPRGTRRLDAIAFQRRLDALGARLTVGPDPTSPFGDAYASRRFSYLRFEVLAPQAREAVALLAEMVDAPRLDAADLSSVKKELETILARRAQQADRLAEERLEARLLAGTLLASPLYGTPETLAAITIEDVREFHRRYFAPANLVVSAVGGLPGNDLLALLRETFGARPPAAPPSLPAVAFTFTPGPEPGAALQVGRGQVGLAWGRLVSVAGPRERLALELAAGVLSARLFNELREKEGLAYAVGATVEPLGGAALVSVRMATGPDKVAQARAGIPREMEALAREPVGRDEVARRANALAGRWAMRLLSSINQAYALGVAEFFGLPHAFGEDYRTLLRGLTPEEVAEAIRTAFQPAAGVWAEVE
jgi:zinc protease